MKATCGAWLFVVLAAAAALRADQPQQAVETFYQQVEIERQPRFSIQGVNVTQQIHYRIQSSFQVHPADKRGNRTAVQTISDAVLVAADPLSRAVFEQSLAAMPGQVFTYKLNKSWEVVSMEGHRENTTAVEVPQPDSSRGLLVSTVIDRDGWKELAQLTLFRPPQTGRPRRPFVRRTTHDWGSLGSWYGSTNFIAGKRVGERQRFSYQHNLEYIPPDGRDPKVTGGTGGLPLEIQNAKFRLYDAKGEIEFDRKHGRVRSVREVFHAGGTVSTSVLGIPSIVELDETQTFKITVTGQRLLKVDP